MAESEENNPLWNREPGIVVVPGSNYAKAMEKFEQFPSKYGSSPGNPYVYRPYPKMMYRAELWQGKPCCMAAPPDSAAFAQPGEFQRAEQAARKFTDRCQIIVKDESERQRALENGYREHPDEAVAYLRQRQLDEGTAAAERHYQDRGMSEAAQAEAAAAEREHFDQEGAHLPAIPEKRRRGRPRKIVQPAE